MSRTTTALRRLLVAAAVGALTLGATATTAHAATDAPGSYRSVTTTSAQNTWIPGALASKSDVDTYRFTTTSARYTRVLLGDLVADYRLRLLDSQGRQVAVSDRTSRANEEIYQRLAAGTYFAVVDAPKGVVSSAPYVLRFTGLAERVQVISWSQYGVGTNASEIVFEVLNNTPYTVSSIGWSDGFTCPPTSGPVDCGPGNQGTLNRVIPPRDRVTFFMPASPAPLGPSYSIRVDTAKGTTFTSKLAVALTGVQATSSGTTYSGTVTNRSTHRTCYPTPVRNTYDDRGVLTSTYEIWTSVVVPAGGTARWTIKGVPPAPKGTVRTSWDVSEDQPC